MYHRDFTIPPSARCAGRLARARRSAFTLIELLLVLVILGILAAIVVPKFAGRAEQAKIAAAKTAISNLKVSLNNFEVDNQRYPSNEEGLGALVNRPNNAPDWHGPYIDQVPVDPWNNPFIYRFPGSSNANGFDLISAGPDGHEGGGDDIQ